MKLGTAIPALNEEDNIESIIQRSLATRQYIPDHSSVTDVEVTVVSDGSTDHTVELASHYKDLIRLIVFSENQGYGAAIKEAWMDSDAELLGFLDADGTCDPKFFAPLCNQLLDKKTDVVLGSRLNSESEVRLFRRRFWVVNAVLTAIAGSLVLGSFLQLLETGSTYKHWSRFIVMTFWLSIVTILLITRCIEYVLGLVRERLQYWQQLRKPQEQF